MEGTGLCKEGFKDRKDMSLTVETANDPGKENCQPSPDSSNAASQYRQEYKFTPLDHRGDGKDFEKKRTQTPKFSKSRSSFSVEQVLHLERVFEQQKYLGSRDRQRIAEQLQMTEAQVKTWFQNRRMKQKRKQADDAERRAKLSFISSLAYNLQHGYQSPYQGLPPAYPDTPLVLRTELNSKYACPPALPWSSLPPYPSPPPYWRAYPGTYAPQL